MKLWRQIMWSVGTASVAAMFALIVAEPVVVFAALGILIAHEVGHWYTAYLGGAEPRLPYFIPLGFIVIGVTSVRHVSRQLSRSIAAAGAPAAGAVAGMLVIVGVVGNVPLLVTIGSLALVAEILLFLMGSDGRKLRTQENNGSRTVGGSGI